MLSRAVLSQKQDIHDNDNYVLSAELASLNTLEDFRVSDASLKEIAEATRHDADLQQMIDYIRHGWPTSRKQCPNTLKHYWTFRDELVQDQGIIMKGPKLLVPAVKYLFFMSLSWKGYFSFLVMLHRSEHFNQKIRQHAIVIPGSHYISIL